jgi:hypothetical protein
MNVWFLATMNLHGGPVVLHRSRSEAMLSGAEAQVQHTPSAFTLLKAGLGYIIDQDLPHAFVPLGWWSLLSQNQTSICCLRLLGVRTED